MRATARKVMLVAVFTMCLSVVMIGAGCRQEDTEVQRGAADWAGTLPVTAQVESRVQRPDNRFLRVVVSPDGSVACFDLRYRNETDGGDIRRVLGLVGLGDTMLTGPRVLDPPERPLLGASFSPEGTLLVLSGEILTGGLQICALGTRQWRLIPGIPEATELRAFSPDGEWIAIIAGFARELWVVRADGSRQVRLSEGRCLIDYPQWRADTGQVLFAKGMPDGEKRIFVASPAEGEDSASPLGVDLDVGWMRVSRSGARALCLATPPGEEQWAYYLLDLAVPMVVAELPIELPGGMGPWAAFDPGGDKILYRLKRDAPGAADPWELWTLPLDDLDAPQPMGVTASDIARVGAWTVNGHIVFLRNLDTELWVVGAAGGEPLLLTTVDDVLAIIGGGG